MEHTPAYGLWSLVLINSAVFIAFAFSFAKPATSRDWRSLGAFSAFVVALFTEMHGFPLTVYLLSGWLQTRFPQVDLFSHEAGHLWHTLFGLLGFLSQWPTVLTLVMFPILVWVYARLACREEREVLAQFGAEYTRYAATTPAFLPIPRPLRVA